MIEPQKWASALGSLSDTVTLPDEDLQFASFKKLFPALTQVPLSEGGVAPQRTDFNTLFKLLGDNIFYLQQGGVFSYSDTADYERGAFVKYNNELYLCIQDNNSFNKHAPTDAEYWLRVALNNELADYLPLTGGNITGNLTVQNKNVVRSVNSVNADDNGNVQLGNLVAIPGEIKWFAFNTVPDGYLVCNGANVSRTTYADLFNAIGTAFGSGDGSTTFTLPNLIDKFAQGSTTVGTYKSAGLPNITGSFAFGDPSAWLGVSLANGAFTPGGGSSTKANQTGGGFSDKIQVKFDAKQYNPIYGNSETVQPPALTLLPCIRY